MDKLDQCIFLVVDFGFNARYLLRTDIFQILKKRLRKIVILTPNSDEEYFQKEFQSENIFLERLNIETCLDYVKISKGQRWCQVIRSFVGDHKCDLGTLEDRYVVFKNKYASASMLKRFFLFFVDIAIRALKYSKLLRDVLLWFEYRFFSPHIHKRLFDKYHPSLLITTSLGNIGRTFVDALIMREAKKRHVQTLSIILSWDNPSGKGMAAVKPDHIIVWTDIMKTEIIEYHNIPADRIFIGGIAHFDIYQHKDQWIPKERIFKVLDLDTEKKLIFLGTKSPTSYPWNADVARMIAEAIANRRIKIPAQLLIRLHPLHFLLKNKKKVHLHHFDEYGTLLKEYPFVKIDTPEILSDRLTMDMPRSEQAKLASILSCTDVMVNMFSTLNIEAAILDVPLVNVAFEGDIKKKTASRQHIDIDIKQVHNKRIIETGGLNICYTPKELIEAINKSLECPGLFREQRRKIVALESGRHRGSAGETIGNYIIELMQKGG